LKQVWLLVQNGEEENRNEETNNMTKRTLFSTCLMVFAFAEYSAASFVPCSYDAEWGEYRYDPFSIAAVIAIAAGFGLAKLGMTPGTSLIGGFIIGILAMAGLPIGPC
jgi:hypothetical protein